MVRDQRGRTLLRVLANKVFARAKQMIIRALVQAVASTAAGLS